MQARKHPVTVDFEYIDDKWVISDYEYPKVNNPLTASDGTLLLSVLVFISFSLLRKRFTLMQNLA